jgi:hypothetical protein
MRLLSVSDVVRKVYRDYGVLSSTRWVAEIRLIQTSMPVVRIPAAADEVREEPNPKGV